MGYVEAVVISTEGYDYDEDQRAGMYVGNRNVACVSGDCQIARLCCFRVVCVASRPKLRTKLETQSGLTLRR